MVIDVVGVVVVGVVSAAALVTMKVMSMVMKIRCDGSYGGGVCKGGGVGSG